MVHAGDVIFLNEKSTVGTGDAEQSESCTVGSDQHLAVLLEHILEVAFDRVNHTHHTSISVAAGPLVNLLFAYLARTCAVGNALDVWEL